MNNYPGICCRVICFMAEERSKAFSYLPAQSSPAQSQSPNIPAFNYSWLLIRAALSPGYSSSVTPDKCALTDHCNFLPTSRELTQIHNCAFLTLLLFSLVLLLVFILSTPRSLIITPQRTTRLTSQPPRGCCLFGVNALSVLIDSGAFFPLLPSACVRLIRLKRH